MTVEEEVYEEELARQRFMCAVCKSLYNKPGMCLNCGHLLKKRAE